MLIKQKEVSQRYFDLTSSKLRPSIERDTKSLVKDRPCLMKVMTPLPTSFTSHQGKRAKARMGGNKSCWAVYIGHPTRVKRNLPCSQRIG